MLDDAYRSAIRSHRCYRGGSLLRGVDVPTVVYVDPDSGVMTTPPNSAVINLVGEGMVGANVIARDGAGLHVIPAVQALAWEYESSVQRINMWSGYEELIRSGVKRQTIRVDDPFSVGCARIEFDQDDGSVECMDAEVTAVSSTQRSKLTEVDAVADGFSSLDDLQQALETHYPGLSLDAPVDIVGFRLVQNVK